MRGEKSNPESVTRPVDDDGALLYAPHAILQDKKEGPYEYNCRISHELIPKFLQKAADDEAYLRLVFGSDFTVSEQCD